MHNALTAGETGFPAMSSDWITTPYTRGHPSPQNSYSKRLCINCIKIQLFICNGR